mmetsp:Transcript_10981/g.13886  ORF Transcript_10981/g.13886 Transcript_10981/m.13886 type:complete len:105 (-) Transcript_10981:518-832(-)
MNRLIIGLDLRRLITPRIWILIRGAYNATQIILDQLNWNPFLPWENIMENVRQTKKITSRQSMERMKSLDKKLSLTNKAQLDLLQQYNMEKMEIMKQQVSMAAD